MLAVKNRLTADDARQIEDAFEAHLASLPADPLEHQPGQESEPARPAGQGDGEAASSASPETGVARQTATIPKTVRHRNKEHLRFVRTQPCLICARQPADAHHLRFAQPQALGRKVSDEFTVPLCRAHHREAHRASREMAWWQSHGIAPLQRLTCCGARVSRARRRARRLNRWPFRPEVGSLRK
jgi:hypothetical protein